MPIKTSVAGVGISAALTNILLYAAYKLGWDMPNDVALSIVTVVAAIAVAVMRVVEIMTGRDLNGNGIVGNGHAQAAAPAIALTEGEKP